MYITIYELFPNFFAAVKFSCLWSQDNKMSSIEKSFYSDYHRGYHDTILCKEYVRLVKEYTICKKIGETYCYTLEGSINRLDGPAIIEKTYKSWHSWSKLHREDGPAMIDKRLKLWFRINQKHRIDGPAVISIYDKKWIIYEWYKYDKHFRDDGPAFIEFYNGKVINQWWSM